MIKLIQLYVVTRDLLTTSSIAFVCQTRIENKTIYHRNRSPVVSKERDR